MLKQRWQKIVVGIAAFVAALFVISFLFPAEYQICGLDEYTHAKICDAYHLGPYVFFWITGQIDAHNGFVTAVASAFIAIFTLTLSKTSEDQGSLTLQSIELARQEFLASHRPHLKVHFPRIIAPEGGEPLKVEFGIINIGDSAGTIMGSVVCLEYLSSDDMPYLPDLAPNNVIRPRRFMPGATDSYFVSGDGDSGIVWATDVFDGGKILYFFGWIVYEDELKVPRTMFFCRCFSKTLGRFTPVEDPEYDSNY